jgi:proline racemase
MATKKKSLPEDDHHHDDDDGIITKNNNVNNNEIMFTLPPRLFSSSETILLKCIDCHAGGEPARVVLSGVIIPTNYETALQKRNYMMEYLDHLRSRLLLEPRGYPCQNVNFVFPPNSTNINNNEKKNDNYYQYVIAEQNKIYPLMSGHNTICVATALLECGVVPMQVPMTEFSLEAPAGPIRIKATCCDDGNGNGNGQVTSITFQNTPSFVERMDITVHVPGGIGMVQCDIAYGGMWYAVVNLEQFHDDRANHDWSFFHPNNAAELCRVGEMIKVACREQYPVQHPTINYPGVDILVFREKTPTRKDNNQLHAKNTVVMSNTVLQWDKPETWTAMLDRSPCGTGTCAVMAVMHARGELQVGESLVHESIVGTQFVGTILEAITIEDGKGGFRPAIVPQITGSAYITQYSQVVVDPQDPFPEGYRVADIW